MGLSSKGCTMSMLNAAVVSGVPRSRTRRGLLAAATALSLVVLGLPSAHAATVRVPSLTSPISATEAVGTTTTIAGRAPAGSKVVVWFHRPSVAGYRALRSVRANAKGAFVLTFKAGDDLSYYVRADGGSRSAVAHVTVTPTLVGAPTRTVAKGHVIVLSGHGAPRSVVTVHLHQVATPLVLVRTVRVTSKGVWTTTVLVNVKYRVFASRGTLHPVSSRVLLVVG